MSGHTTPEPTVERPVPGSSVRVLEEVQRLGLSNSIFSDSEIATTLGNITIEELDEVRSLKNPPAVVRSILEVTCLILDASRHQSQSHIVPPDWKKVQKKINDPDLFSKVLNYDLEHLRGAPALTSFLASEYFNTAGNGVAQSRPTSRASSVPNSRGGRFSPNPRARRANLEPLTFSRVLRANRAAAALFKWCVGVLASALPEPAQPPQAIEVQIPEFSSTPRVSPKALPSPTASFLPPKRRYHFDYGWDDDKSGGAAFPPDCPKRDWPVRKGFQFGDQRLGLPGPLMVAGGILAAC